MSSSKSDDVWDRLAEDRDLFEHIVETNGPYAPHAERVLTALDERK